MGCNGCELYPTEAQLRNRITDVIAKFLGHKPDTALKQLIGRSTEDGSQATILNRDEIAEVLATAAVASTGRVQP